MKHGLALLIGAGVVAAMAACAKSTFDVDEADRIRVGETTADGVVQILGAPTSKSGEVGQTETWTYSNDIDGFATNKDYGVQLKFEGGVVTECQLTKREFFPVERERTGTPVLKSRVVQRACGQG